MERTGRRVRSGAGALAVAAALGFGVTQAVAEPREPERRACTQEWCDRLCRSYGSPYGLCVDNVCNCKVIDDGLGAR